MANIMRTSFLCLCSIMAVIGAATPLTCGVTSNITSNTIYTLTSCTATSTFRIDPLSSGDVLENVEVYVQGGNRFPTLLFQGTNSTILTLIVRNIFISFDSIVSSVFDGQPQDSIIAVAANSVTNLTVSWRNSQLLRTGVTAPADPLSRIPPPNYGVAGPTVGRLAYFYVNATVDGLAITVVDSVFDWNLNLGGFVIQSMIIASSFRAVNFTASHVIMYQSITSRGGLGSMFFLGNLARQPTVPLVISDTTISIRDSLAFSVMCNKTGDTGCQFPGEVSAVYAAFITIATAGTTVNVFIALINTQWFVRVPPASLLVDPVEAIVIFFHWEWPEYCRA